MTLKFQNPDYLLFLLLLLGVYLLRRRFQGFLGYSLVHRLKSLPTFTSRWVRLPEVFTVAALVLVGFTLLDPVLSLSRMRIVTRGLNIVMLVDLSSSMLEYMEQEGLSVPDGPTETKLEAVKGAIRQFVEGRDGDRVGTLVFSERAYVVNPLTVDYDYVKEYLRYVDYRTLAGEGRTAIGEGIFSGLGLLRWKDPDRQSRGVIIIFTDGENNAGRTIYEALEKALEEKVRVYLVGLQIWYLSDRENLEAALSATGGGFFDVQNKEQLEEAYQRIDSLERQQLVTEHYVRNAPYYYPFLGLALLLVVMASLLRAFPYFVEIC